MNHIIRLSLRSNEGALIRALGLTERRGFRLVSCHLQDAAMNQQRLDLTVSSSRSIQTLRHQLERLHDVVEVTCFTLTESEHQTISAVGN